MTVELSQLSWILTPEGENWTSISWSLVFVPSIRKTSSSFCLTVTIVDFPGCRLTFHEVTSVYKVASNSFVFGLFTPSNPILSPWKRFKSI